jgi:valyl-tRNA synthetase
VDELGDRAGGDPSVLRVAADVLGAVRRAKTTAKRSMRAKVRRLTVSGPATLLAAVEASRHDVVDAGGVEELQLEEADTFSVAVDLAEEA